MLSPREHVETLWHWPATSRDVLAIAVRLIIAVVLILLIGALSCSVALARKTTKPHQPQLSIQERLEAEQRLWDLGYWGGTADGKFDSASRHALVAFQKVEGRARTGNLNLDELTALRNATRPVARYPRNPHAEIDLERQVLFLIGESGTVFRILPVSTGNGQLYRDKGAVHRARTPTGTFKVFRKIDGWRSSSLGLLYYPSYIVNGIAIHGSLSVPVHPASHGCIRVPMFAAKQLSSFLPVGTEVVIYDDQLSRTVVEPEVTNENSNRSGDPSATGKSGNTNCADTHIYQG